jgi:hypothetical protein
MWNKTDGFVTVQEGGNTHRGRYSIRGDIVEVTYGAAGKRERVDAMPPQKLAELLLRELVRAEAKKAQG